MAKVSVRITIVDFDDLQILAVSIDGMSKVMVSTMDAGIATDERVQVFTNEPNDGRIAEGISNSEIVCRAVASRTTVVDAAFVDGDAIVVCPVALAFVLNGGITNVVVIPCFRHIRHIVA